MIDRKRKTRMDQSTIRQLRFEPLESRVQFAVDYLVFAPEVWLVEAPMTMDASEFIGESSVSARPLDPEWEPAFEFRSPSIPTGGAIAVSNDWVWDSNLDIGLAISDPYFNADLPLDASIFGTTDNFYYTEPFQSQPFEILGVSITPSSVSPADLAWSDSALGIALPVSSVEPTFPISDQLGADAADFDLLADSSNQLGYIIVGLAPFDASDSPETFLSNGPSIEVFPDVQDGFGDSILLVGPSSGPTHASLATHATAIGQTFITSALSVAVMSPG